MRKLRQREDYLTQVAQPEVDEMESELTLSNCRPYCTHRVWPLGQDPLALGMSKDIVVYLQIEFPFN